MAPRKFEWISGFRLPLAAGLVAMYLFIIGPAVTWEYRRPPGLNKEWWTFWILVTATSFCLNFAGLVHGPGWKRIWYVIFFFPTYWSASNLHNLWMMDTTWKTMFSQENRVNQR